MDLSFQAPGEYNFIRSISATGISIGAGTYSQSLILTADQLFTDWPPQRFEDLQPSHLDELFHLKPELVLLGTGSKQQFPGAEFMMEFYRRGIGIEVMATAPACRTFNVLVAESRQVLAALLPLG
ncbi:MAG TPA: Mth938-like domain-containing protein [Xanthomonadales bacterium]|nr:Mth938-like domain-containing protein [Xanthomonadales bacterium]